MKFIDVLNKIFNDEFENDSIIKIGEDIILVYKDGYIMSDDENTTLKGFYLSQKMLGEEVTVRHEKYNTDFYDRLPGMICEVLEAIKAEYEDRSWFERAWKSYRKHVLSCKDIEDMKMPGYIFNSYIETDENEVKYEQLSFDDVE